MVKFCHKIVNDYRPQKNLQEGNVFTPINQAFCSRGAGGVDERGCGEGVCGERGVVKGA